MARLAIKTGDKEKCVRLNLEGFKTHIVVAKKDLTIFNQKHNNNPTEFYFDVLHHLLNGRINNEDCQYNMYLSQRGNNSIHRFQQAVYKAQQISEDGVKTNNCILEIVPGKEMPELSIVDYMIWAIQRELVHGEGRYFAALKKKYGSVTYLYQEPNAK